MPSLPGMLVLLGFESTEFLVVWQCVLMGDSLERKPTGGGEKAPLPKIPARFGANPCISGSVTDVPELHHFCPAWSSEDGWQSESCLDPISEA